MQFSLHFPAFTLFPIPSHAVKYVNAQNMYIHIYYLQPSEISFLLELPSSAMYDRSRTRPSFPGWIILFESSFSANSSSFCSNVHPSFTSTDLLILLTMHSQVIHTSFLDSQGMLAIYFGRSFDAESDRLLDSNPCNLILVALRGLGRLEKPGEDWRGCWEVASWVC